MFKPFKSAIFLLCLPLDGCLDMKQDFKVNSDGDATLSVRVTSDPAMVSLDAFGENCIETDDIDEGVRMVIQRSEVDGILGCDLRFEGHIDVLAETLNSGTIGPGYSAQEGGFDISRTGNTYVLRSGFPTDAIGTLATSEAEAEEMLAAVIEGTQGLTIEWTLTAPTIIATNGELSADSKTATLIRPASDTYTAFEGDADGQPQTGMPGGARQNHPAAKLRNPQPLTVGPFAFGETARV